MSDESDRDYNREGVTYDFWGNPRVDWDKWLKAGSPKIGNDMRKLKKAVREHKERNE